MSEKKYIDADELIEGRVGNDPVVIAAKCASAADVQEVKHARFASILVKKEDWKGNMQSWYYPNACSNCKIALIGTENYCSNCGAKMDGREKEE